MDQKYLIIHLEGQRLRDPDMSPETEELLQLAANTIHDLHVVLDTRDGQVAELRAQLDRARKALEEIRDFPFIGSQASQKMQGIARETLSLLKP